MKLTKAEREEALAALELARTIIAKTAIELAARTGHEDVSRGVARQIFKAKEILEDCARDIGFKIQSLKNTYTSG